MDKIMIERITLLLAHIFIWLRYMNLMGNTITASKQSWDRHPSVKNLKLKKKTEKLRCNLTFVGKMIWRNLAKDVRTGVPVSFFSSLPIPSYIAVCPACFVLSKPPRFPTPLLHLPSLNVIQTNIRALFECKTFSF